MIDVGKGTPLVLIPGIQGRWEWMMPAIEALAARARVISYSLCGDRGSGWRLVEEQGFENYVSQLDSVFDRTGLRRAVVCGVSYGGLIAVHYAARRQDRVNGLVLVSTPGPRWRPDRRLMRYVRAPRLLAPLFAARSSRVVGRELIAALPRRHDRWAFRRRHVMHILRAPFSPRRMAQRVRFGLTVNFAEDCGRVSAPTLVVTGEQELDRIVSIETTRDYVACIPGARHVVFERTGHLGLVTQPARFADLVCAFVEEAAAKGGGQPSDRLTADYELRTTDAKG